MEIRKSILDRFQEHIDISYDNYCKMHGARKNEQGLITWLIDQELIPATLLHRYTLLKEFEELHLEKAIQKTAVVNVLAHRFNISERTVWSILKQANPRTKHAGTENR